jgi:hypothetical protein
VNGTAARAPAFGETGRPLAVDHDVVEAEGQDHLRPGLVHRRVAGDLPFLAVRRVVDPRP